MHIFPEAEGIGQELFLLIIYCYFIFTGSKAIAEGCDVLRDVFGSGIVGSLILPLLGALPDSIILIFSLTGTSESEEQTAESIAVGIGSLIGATTLLLTIPFAVSIFLGSRALDENGVAMSEYKPIAKHSSKLVLRPVLPKSFSLWNNGITTLPNTPRSVIWMLITACTYLFVEIPAIFYHSDADKGAKHEHIFLLLGFVVAAILFFAYMKAMASDGDNDNLVEERRQRGNRFLAWSRENRSLISSLDPVTLFNLLDSDRDGFLDAEDIQTGFKILGFTDISNADALAIFNLADQDNNILIDLEEWTAFVREFILLNEQQPHRGRREKEMLVKVDPNSINQPSAFEPSAADFNQAGNLNGTSAQASSSSGNIQMPNSNSPHHSQDNNEYGSASYIEETNRLWFQSNNNSPVRSTSAMKLPPPPAHPQLAIANLNLEPSQPLLGGEGPQTPRRQSYMGLAGSYRGSTAPIPGVNAGNRPGINDKPKFIRLESSASLLAQSNAQQPLIASPSALSGAMTSTGNYYEPGRSSSELNMSAVIRPQQTNDQTNLFMNYHQVHAHEASEVLYLDPNRSEEEVDPSVKQTPPPVPPELMTAILKWFLDTKNNKVGLLYIGNRLRWAIHLWAKRTRRLGHYSFTLETGERIMKLVKLDQATQMPTHTRKRTTSFAVDKHSHLALELGDNDTLHSSRTGRHHASNTFFNPESAVYHQNEWEDLNMPRWCFASPQIKAWYLAKVASKGGEAAINSPTATEHTPSPLSPATPGENGEDDENSNLLFSRKKVTFQEPKAAAPVAENSSGNAPVGELPLLLELFQFADHSNQRSLTITDIHLFAQNWGLYQHDITPNVIKVIYYNIDLDYDRAIDVFNFRLFLEELVKIPQIGTRLLKRAVGSSKRHTEGRVYTQKEKDQWVEDVEDRNDELNQEEQRTVEHYCFCNHCQEYLGDHHTKKEHEGDDDDEANKGLSPLEVLQRTRRAHTIAGFGYLLLGIALIFIFSDPLIEIVTQLGKSSGIPTFYLSFVIIPIVSNSAEVITSLMFAKERTTTSISLTLSALYGAAILNNTFNTGIFYFLLWLKKLPWVYSSEVIAVIMVQFIVGAITYRANLRQIHAIACALVFPLAVATIYVTENVFGLKDW